MGILEIILTSIGGVTVSGLLLYAGTRYTAQKTNEVGSTLAAIEARKVGLDEFRAFTERYDAELKRMDEKQTATQKELEDTRGGLKAAVLYIVSLRRTLRKNNIFPDPIPERIESYYTLWDAVEEEER